VFESDELKWMLESDELKEKYDKYIQKKNELEKLRQKVIDYLKSQKLL